MYRHARTFTNCIEAFNRFRKVTIARISRIDIAIFVIMCCKCFSFRTFRHNHLTVDIRWNTTHLVVNCWYYWNWLFGDVNVREFLTNLKYRWKTFHDRFSTQVRHIKQDVVFLRTTTTTFFNFLVHRT